MLYLAIQMFNKWGNLRGVSRKSIIHIIIMPEEFYVG